MADHTRNIKENTDSANINLIANKEAAYALTGVAVGTVYKTEDTGQILEKVDYVPLIQEGFTLELNSSDPTSLPDSRYDGYYAWSHEHNAFVLLSPSNDIIASIKYEGGRWSLRNAGVNWQGVIYMNPVRYWSPSDADVHPSELGDFEPTATSSSYYYYYGDGLGFGIGLNNLES